MSPTETLRRESLRERFLRARVLKGTTGREHVRGRYIRGRPFERPFRSVHLPICCEFVPLRLKDRPVHRKRSPQPALAITPSPPTSASGPPNPRPHHKLRLPV